jgi:hypothetical protein
MSKVVALKNLIILNSNMTLSLALAFLYYLTYKYLCWIRTNSRITPKKETKTTERNMKNSKANSMKRQKEKKKTKKRKRLTLEKIIKKRQNIYSFPSLNLES